MKQSSFEEYIKGVLNEDYHVACKLYRYYSASRRVFESGAGDYSEEYYQQVVNGYKDILNYTQLLADVLEPYKDAPPELADIPVLNDFKASVEQDYSLAHKYNRHFGASKICVEKMGQNLPNCEQAVEKYDWVRIVFKNLVNLLEALQ